MVFVFPKMYTNKSIVSVFIYIYTVIPIESLKQHIPSQVAVLYEFSR